MGNARSKKALVRFWAPQAHPGKLISLSPEEAHHLKDVLRLTTGDEVLLLDLKGREFEGRVEKIRGKEVFVRVKGLLREEGPPKVSITILFPLLKKDHLAFLVEKAVELGLSRVILVETSRCVAKGHAGLIERLKRRATQALKQCRRLWPLEILGPLPLSEAASLPAEKKIWAYEGGQGRRPGEVLSGREVLLLSGPEGGFSPEEALFLEEKGFEKVTLGRYVLRAETAAFYLMCLAHHELLLE